MAEACVCLLSHAAAEVNAVGKVLPCVRVAVGDLVLEQHLDIAALERVVRLLGVQQDGAATEVLVHFLKRQNLALLLVNERPRLRVHDLSLLANALGVDE